MSDAFFHHLHARIIRAIGGIALIAACAACSAVDLQGVEKSEPNIMPTNYRPDILAFLRTYLNDPTKIRGAMISEPALRPTAADQQRYAVCLKFNARKSNGEYEGVRERIVYFLAGRLDTMIDVRRDQCAGATYQPFPELEALTR